MPKNTQKWMGEPDCALTFRKQFITINIIIIIIIINKLILN